VHPREYLLESYLVYCLPFLSYFAEEASHLIRTIIKKDPGRSAVVKGKEEV